MLKFDDYQFNYSVAGNRNNLPILFLHGFMGSSNDFNNAIQLLADQFYCLAIDLPGHGKTKVFGGDHCYTMPNTAQASIALLDRLNITEKCFLVGYSMGGRLALYLTLHFPDRFAKVVLESASPGLKTAGEKLSRIQKDSQLAKELETGDFKAFLLKWYNQPIFNSFKKHPKFEELLESRLYNNTPLELAKSLRHMGTGYQPYLQDKLEHNKIPLLLLVGEYDEKFQTVNKEMLKACQVANMKLIKNCGHNIHFEDINLWVRHLKEFCN